MGNNACYFILMMKIVSFSRVSKMKKKSLLNNHKAGKWECMLTMLYVWIADILLFLRQSD